MLQLKVTNKFKKDLKRIQKTGKKFRTIARCAATTFDGN